MPGRVPAPLHECFPEVSPQAFFMRKRFIQSQMSVVDRFLAPSNFLRDRFVDWGLPAEKIVAEEYGRLPRPRQHQRGTGASATGSPSSVSSAVSRASTSC